MLTIQITKPLHGSSGATYIENDTSKRPLSKLLKDISVELGLV